MKKHHILYLVAGIAIFGLIAGGLYAYKFRECVRKVSYVPPREQQGIIGGSGYLLGRVTDKGDYYKFMGQEFKTSEDAIGACIWR